MDPNDSQIVIQQMEAKHLKGGLNCFTGHNLAESLSTVKAFYSCDPKAFYVAINSIDDHVIGVCGAPVITHNSGFLGLYSVEKDFQNRGIGKKLFNLCMKYIGDRNCGLHSVPEKFEMYRNKAGYHVVEGVTIVIRFAIPQDWDKLLKIIIKNTKIEFFDKQNEELMTKIIEYDSKVHKQSRNQLLRLTLNKDDYNTFVAIDQNNNVLLGYGCIRPDNSGKAIIGPLYANNDTVAEVLIYNLIKSSVVAQNNGLHFITISSSSGGIRIAQKLQITERDGYECKRIFTKHPIPADHKYIYCIHSPNFSL